MSGNSFGTLFRVTTFGESHGAALGAVVDGVPAGLEIDIDHIQTELDRRRPGGGAAGSTARQEGDRVEILSGVFEGRATGTPIALLIRNTDARSGDYSNVASSFRPGHADFTFNAKYGFRDHRGGGRSSGRETAARVAAGAIAKLFLRQMQIDIAAGVSELGGVTAGELDFAYAACNPLRCLCRGSFDAMNEKLDSARSRGDSIGAVVSCRVNGVPAGWGEPVFDKLDALLAHAMLSLGAVKGIEFGDGFAAARKTGSENNDPITPAGFASNNAGGILGGISDGDTIEFRVAVKPTPSIALPQQSVDADGNPVEMVIKGRHDSCIAPRLVPVVEAMTALVLADLALQQRCARL